MFILTLTEIFLIAFWLLGIITDYTLGGFIHVFLGITILLIISRFIAGRNNDAGNDEP